MQTPKIKISGQDVSANFVSEFHILHTANEFILSLIEVIPQMKYIETDGINPITKKPGKVTRMQSDGILQKIVGRYGMSPAAFKKFVSVMNQNLKKYEDKFGEISINPPENMY